MTPQERHYARLGLAERLPPPERAPQSGHIRFWAKTAAGGLALLVAAHIVASDPIARAADDMRRGGWTGTPASSPVPPASCLTILICEMPR